MSQTIRVLLVDNHKLTCTAVRSLLSGVADIILLDEAATTTNLQQLYARHEPDILLLSFELVREPPSTLATVINCCPAAKILLLATNCTGICASDFAESNIQGCILRDQVPDELILAIRASMAGVTCYSQLVAKKLAQLQDEQGLTDETGKLTGREKEALRLLADGLTNKQIALQLQIVESTVEYHIGNIFQKLGVESRVEAAVWVNKQRRE